MYVYACRGPAPCVTGLCTRAVPCSAICCVFCECLGPAANQHAGFTLCLVQIGPNWFVAVDVPRVVVELCLDPFFEPFLALKRDIFKALWSFTGIMRGAQMQPLTPNPPPPPPQPSKWPKC